MMRNRSFSSMPIRALVDPSEWMILGEEVQAIAAKTPSILGVLSIGSLIQTFRPPVDFYTPRRTGPLGMAYEEIRHPERRKVFPSNTSDLDVWICTADTLFSAQAQDVVDLGGLALLGELAAGNIKRGTPQWSAKKQSVFGPYYKQMEMYDGKYVAQNGNEPWMARSFKRQLDKNVAHRLPGMCERINRFTQKKIPGDFFEIRAFPQSLFNLKPDDVMMASGEYDREPFPRIANDQWISPEHASSILYASSKCDIYPFNPNGKILGSRIDEGILATERRAGGKSYGGILIKPDAIEHGQIGLIKEKIDRGIKKIHGKIVIERLYDRLSSDDIKSIYPLLRGSDLAEAIEYLQSGPVMVFIVESDQTAEKTFNAVNAIKGPRVGDRTEERLRQGRITTGGVRDLLPLPGDEEKYRALFQTIQARKTDSSLRFTEEEYAYYSRNLMHTPDNAVELRGLLKLVGMAEVGVC